MGQTRGSAAEQGDADGASVHGGEGGIRRLAPLLPHGRLLRALLRRRARGRRYSSASPSPAATAPTTSNAFPWRACPCARWMPMSPRRSWPGRTVSICDQVEDPKEAKGIVKRELVRTITPGTVTEPPTCLRTSANQLPRRADGLAPMQAGLAFIDVTTGELLVARVEDEHRTNPARRAHAHGPQGSALAGGSFEGRISAIS